MLDVSHGASVAEGLPHPRASAGADVRGVLPPLALPGEPARRWSDFAETVTELSRSTDAGGPGVSEWRLLAKMDADIRDHAHGVAAVTVAIARVMGLDATRTENFRVGALLHDVGKLAVPRAILYKPGPLTIAEWRVMRKHPAYARDILAAVRARREAVDAAYSHHERWDGDGYPRGLRGAEIPLVARIVAVADVVDSLSSDRSYRAAWPAEEVREYVTAGAGLQFDPGVGEAYLDLRAA